MSIDTEDKRRSVLAHGLPFLVVYPSPDGTIDAEDRKHIAGYYRNLIFVELKGPNRGLLIGVYNGET